MKANSLKPIESGYGDDKVIFFLRMISIAEEDEYNVKFNDISDSDSEKYPKTFAILKEALGEFSTEMPVKLEKVKGEFVRVPLVKDAQTPAEAINAAFNQRTIENERTVLSVYNRFKNQLSPETRFL